MWGSPGYVDPPAWGRLGVREGALQKLALPAACAKIKPCLRVRFSPPSVCLKGKAVSRVSRGLLKVRDPHVRMRLP